MRCTVQILKKEAGVGPKAQWLKNRKAPKQPPILLPTNDNVNTTTNNFGSH